MNEELLVAIVEKMDVFDKTMLIIEKKWIR
jgi:hypothetical protein